MRCRRFVKHGHALLVQQGAGGNGDIVATRLKGPSWATVRPSTRSRSPVQRYRLPSTTGVIHSPCWCRSPVRLPPDLAPSRRRSDNRVGGLGRGVSRADGHRGGDEVLQHAQAFAEVGLDGLDDLAGRFGHLARACPAHWRICAAERGRRSQPS